MTNRDVAPSDGVRDADVVAVLALLLDALDRLPDELQREPEPLLVVDEENETERVIEVGDLTAGTLPVSDVALARVALDYLLATDPDAAALLPRALGLATDHAQGTIRFDPLTLGVGALVITVLQTEVTWTRSDSGRWRLRVHKRALSDSTIATLIRGLLQLPRHDKPDDER